MPSGRAVLVAGSRVGLVGPRWGWPPSTATRAGDDGAVVLAEGMLARELAEIDAA